MKKSVALFLLFVLAACAQQTTTDVEPQDFRYGSEGIVMRFSPNLPPPRIYDSERSLNVLIEVENRGTSPVGPGSTVFLSGFDTNIITNIDTSGVSLPVIEGRDAYVTQGGFDTVSFEGIIRDLADLNVDKYEPTLLATACYPYHTVASASVCLDPQPFTAQRREVICTPQSVSLGGGQGAPIAVTSIDVEPSPGKTRFKIYIQNVGYGDVFKSKAMNHCSPYSTGLTFRESDWVRITDVSVSGLPITSTCKPSDDGFVRLTNGQAVVFCELQTVPGQNAFVTPMTVQLDYGYRESISQRVEIRASER